jgi:ParB family chromosome partitioning protein
MNEHPLNGHADEPGRVLEFDPPDIETPPGNRPATPDTVGDLLESMRAVGQRVPGIVYPHPEKPRKWLCGAGNRRLLCCRILGIPFKAIVVPEPPSEVELIRLRLTENVIRKGMTAEEIARDIERYMEVANATQEQAAEFFGFSKGYVSKLLAPSKRLVPDLHHLRDNPDICRDAIRIIASMPTPELQRQLAERVLATINSGGVVKRDMVERLAAQMKGSKRPKKAKRMKAKVDDASIEYPEDWGWDKVIAFGQRIAEAGRQGAKMQNVPVAAVLISLLRG